MCLSKAFTLYDVDRINSILKDRAQELSNARRPDLKYISRDKTIIPFDPEKIEKTGRAAMAKFISQKKARKA